MIDKDIFVKAIEMILKRRRTQDRIKHDLKSLGLEMAEDILEDTLVSILDAALNLNIPRGHELVSWWLYDCGSARAAEIPSKFFVGETEYGIRTPSDLYDLAVTLQRGEIASWQ